MSINYQEELNKSQQAVVFYNDGPSLVIAGAGAGKTRVLVYKISYLLEQGYKPWNILAITFTNKAAREMKERIALQVGEETARYLWMDTFHSIFARILRVWGEKLGYSSNYTIYDQADSRSLIKSIIKEMQLDDKTYKPALVQERISSAKNRMVLPAEYGASSDYYKSDMRQRVPAIRDIYRIYNNRCRQANAMDFDDLLVNTLLLLRQFPDVCNHYAQQFRYVLVDEYQDTNVVQHNIVWELTREHRHVCVVGDDAQSIYSFRGANIDNILKFRELYPEAKLFKLEQNYRSTQMIVNAANSLIAKNSEQIPKEVFSQKELGTPLALIQAHSDVEEGDAVVNRIEGLRSKELISYNEVAILYRTNAQSRIFEESLRGRKIPYRIYGGQSFYQRKEIKDIIAYFRMAVNPSDEEALKRIINYPARGIGDTTLSRIVEAATDAEVSPWEVVCTPEHYLPEVNAGTQGKMRRFADLVLRFLQAALTQDAYEVAQVIIKESGIAADLNSDDTPEGRSRQENCQELLNGVHDFVLNSREEGNEHELLSDYLPQVSLLSDQDRDKSGSEERVTLMTMHAAKGLEFEAVFVAGIEENLFPSPPCANSERELEEERRLFYVAITRAKKYCTLSYAKSRYRYGKFEFVEPSRFLKDIAPQFIEQPCGSRPRPSQRPSGAGASSLFDKSVPRRHLPGLERPASSPVAARNLQRIAQAAFSDSAHAQGEEPSLHAGQVIEHERFGIGDVLKVEGTGDNAKATIQFRNVGVKQLLLKFARFKVIE